MSALKWKLEIHEPSNDAFGRTASIMGMRNGYIIQLANIIDPSKDSIKALRAIVRAANKKP